MGFALGRATWPHPASPPHCWTQGWFPRVSERPGAPASRGTIVLIRRDGAAAGPHWAWDATGRLACTYLVTESGDTPGVPGQTRPPHPRCLSKPELQQRSEATVLSSSRVQPEGPEGSAKLAATAHLDVAAVVATGGELDPAEGDGALQGHLDGRLLDPVLAIGPRGAGDGAAAEVPLDWRRQGKDLRTGPPTGTQRTRGAT